ncbi:MAG: hypothetical protein V8T86_10810 [Victivallis sp.]
MLDSRNRATGGSSAKGARSLRRPLYSEVTRGRCRELVPAAAGTKPDLLAWGGGVYTTEELSDASTGSCSGRDFILRLPDLRAATTGPSEEALTVVRALIRRWWSVRQQRA